MKRTWSLVVLAFWLWLVPPLLAQPAPLPATDLWGKPVPLDQLQSKPTVLMLAGQACEQEANAVSRELLIAMNGASDRYNFVLIMDLQSVPGFAQGLTRTLIEARLAQADHDLESHLAERGETFRPPLRLALPDWSGEAIRAWFRQANGPEYDVFREGLGRTRYERDRQGREQMRLRSQVQVFVLDPALKLKAHFAGRSAGARAIEALRPSQFQATARGEG